MKDLYILDKFRTSQLGDDKNGSFKVFVGRNSFFVIASNGGGWEHVSVSLKNQKRCPTWEEMCAIKDMFFEPEEEVFQIHPKKSEYVNIHPYCLHLWRPLKNDIPVPPKIFV